MVATLRLSGLTGTFVGPAELVARRVPDPEPDGPSLRDRLREHYADRLAPYAGTPHFFDGHAQDVVDALDAGEPAVLAGSELLAHVGSCRRRSPRVRRRVPSPAATGRRGRGRHGRAPRTACRLSPARGPPRGICVLSHRARRPGGRGGAGRRSRSRRVRRGQLIRLPVPSALRRVCLATRVSCS